MIAERTIVGIKLAAAASVTTGSLVLIGWAFDIGALKSIQPIWVAMKANTAVCFVLTGIALYLIASPLTALKSAATDRNTTRPPLSNFRAQLPHVFARGCILLTGLIGLVTLGEYIFDWNAGIDLFLFDEPEGAVGTTHPGRMAPETAINTVLVSVALWINSSNHKTIPGIIASVCTGLLVITLPSAALLSYLTTTLGIYGWFGLTLMAVHTSFLFILLGAIIIVLGWQTEVLPWSLSRRTTVAFACGMALLVFIGINTNRSQFWMKETSRQIAHNEKMLGDISGLMVELIGTQTSTRGYVITGNQRFLDNFHQAQSNSSARLNGLRKLEFSAEGPIHQHHFMLLETQSQDIFHWFQKVIDSRHANISAATRSQMIIHGEELTDKLRGTFDLIKDDHRRIIDRLKQDAEQVSRLAYLIAFIGTSASLLIFLAVLFRLNLAVNEREQRERELRENEERFRKIAESAQDAIIMMGPDQRIRLWNSAAEHIFGYSAAETMGEELHSLITPVAAQAAFARAFPHFRKTGQGALIGKITEVSALRKGGEEFPVELTISATRLDNQWHAISIVRDITLRKQMEERLRDSEERYRTMIDNSNDMIWVMSPECRFTYINRQTSEATGHALNAWLGKGFELLLRAEDMPGVIAIHQRILQGEKVHYDINGRRANGEVLVLSVNTSPIFKNDQVTGTISFARDITEQRQAEDRLAEQISELRQWRDITLGREMRIISIKHEVNELLVQSGQPPRYYDLTEQANE